MQHASTDGRHLLDPDDRLRPVHCSIGDRRVSWIDSDRLALVGAHRPLLQHRDRGADKVGR